jgi:hypothetical protein
MSTFPYDGRFAVHRTLPEQGTPRAEILDALQVMATEEDARAPCTAATTTTTRS